MFLESGPFDVNKNPRRLDVAKGGEAVSNIEIRGGGRGCSIGKENEAELMICMNPRDVGAT